MSNIAIEVSNLSKRYRIGLKEEIHDTFIGLMTSWLKSPISNYRRVSSLSSFSNNGESDDIIWALKDVSFEIEKGEAVGIIGKNGAGKSTLLKILCQITEPTSGKAVVNGRVSSLLEVGTGFHPELTGRENVFLNGAILGMTKKEIDQKFDKIVDFSEIGKFIDTPVKRYSSGMRVRLAFAVAAHLDPDILLIDEVLAVGDFEFQKKCLGKMGNIAEKGRTVLLVSHNMRSIASLCEKAILIEKGGIEMEGKATSVISHYLHGSNQLSDLDEYRVKGVGKVAKITNVRLESDRQFFYSGEEIQFFVSMRSKMDFDNVYLNCLIRDKMQQAIGMVVHEEPFMLQKGKKLTVSLTLNKDIGLVPDDYYLTFTLRVCKSALDNHPQKKLDALVTIPLLTILGRKEFSDYIEFSQWKNSWGNNCYITDLEII